MVFESFSFFRYDNLFNRWKCLSQIYWWLKWMLLQYCKYFCKLRRFDAVWNPLTNDLLCRIFTFKTIDDRHVSLVNSVNEKYFIMIMLYSFIIYQKRLSHGHFRFLWSVCILTAAFPLNYSLGSHLSLQLIYIKVVLICRLKVKD